MIDERSGPVLQMDFITRYMTDTCSRIDERYTMLNVFQVGPAIVSPAL
jgi:hypothetical protein